MSWVVAELLRCGALALLQRLSGDGFQSGRWSRELTWESGTWEGEEIERAKIYTHWLQRVRACQYLDAIGDGRWRQYTGAGC